MTNSTTGTHNASMSYIVTGRSAPTLFPSLSDLESLMKGHPFFSTDIRSATARAVLCAFGRTTDFHNRSSAHIPFSRVEAKEFGEWFYGEVAPLILRVCRYLRVAGTIRIPFSVSKHRQVYPAKTHYTTGGSW